MRFSRCWSAVSLVALLGAGLAAAQTPEDAPDLAAEFDALQSAFEETEAKYMEELREMWREAIEAAESRKAAGETNASPAMPMTPPKSAADEFAPKFVDLAKRAAGGPHEVRPLVWLVQHAFGSQRIKIQGKAEGEVPPGRAALATLIEKHLGAEEIEPLCETLSYFGGGEAAAEDGLRRILKGATEKRVKAAATAGLARLLYEDDGKEWAPDASGKYVSKDRIAPDVVAARHKEAADLFKTLRKDHPESEHAENAAGYLFEIEHLQVGMTVPDEALVDSEGVAFKLSDYRGKALAIDFWGFW